MSEAVTRTTPDDATPPATETVTETVAMDAAAAEGAATETVAQPEEAPAHVGPPQPTEPWRRRVVRTLLYGKADRNAKARARIGLAMLAFTAIYAIIAGRLVLFALEPE